MWSHCAGLKNQKTEFDSLRTHKQLKKELFDSMVRYRKGPQNVGEQKTQKIWFHSSGHRIKFWFETKTTINLYLL